MQNTVLIVLSVRDIPSVKQCIDHLPCHKIWFRGYTEQELAPLINDFVKHSDFENYFIAPDDLIIRPHQFDILDKGLGRHDIVTGWGIVRQNAEYTTIINPNNYLSDTIFKHHTCNEYTINNTYMNSYKTYEVNALPNEIETAFTGWFYTGMKRHVLLKYPYECLNPPLASSDLLFSRRVLSDKQYKQICFKQAQVIHLSNYYYIRGTHGFLPPSGIAIKKEIIKTF